MYVERSGTVPQQDLSSLLSLPNGPSVDAGAELSMERPGSATARPDLRIIARQRTIRRCRRRAKYGAEIRIMWGVTAMHGLAPVEAKARGLT